MPKYYPIFLNLESRICLVVGAGSVGARKASSLLNAGALVRLVATHLGDAAAGLLNEKNIELVRELYQPRHLDAVSLAFAATDSRSVNTRIAADARSRNIPVNCADSQEDRDEDIDGEFIVPALMRRGDFCIAISTGGASPKLAQRIRHELEAAYSVEYEGYVELLKDMRSYIKEHVADPARRAVAFESLIETEAEAALRLLLRNSGCTDAGNEARREARRIVEAALLAPLE